MAYYYVKSPGAGSPTSTTLQTGVFPAAYYASIAAAVTAGAGVGDYIMCAKGHTHNYGASTVIGIDGSYVYSVNETNCDQIDAGASEEATGGTYDLTLLVSGSLHKCYIEGVSFKVGDDLSIMPISSAGQKVVAKDCKFITSGSNASDLLRITSSDGDEAELINCQVGFGEDSHNLGVSGGAKVTIRGLSIEPGYTAAKSLFSTGGNGGCTIELYDADLTGLTTVTSWLVNDLVSSDDRLCITGGRIKVNSGFDFFETAPAILNYHIDLIGVDTADAYYTRTGVNDYGTWDSDISIYRAATYDGTNEYSLKLVSNADANVNFPLRIKLASLPVSAATQTFTTHIARDDSTADFHTSEMWLEVEYPDSTDEALGVVVSTRDTTIGSTTDVATETGLWTGLGGTSAQMSLSSGSLTTGAGVVTVWLCCGVASQTLYVDPKVVIS